MIPFVTILEHYESSLHKKYSAKLLPSHLKAGILNPVGIVAAPSARIMRLRNG